MTKVDSSIRSRDFDHDGYSDAEVHTMRKDGDTSRVMNGVRHDAGIRGPEVAIRGDDKSNAELKREWYEHDSPDAAGGTVLHAAVEGAEGTALHVLAPVLFGYHAAKQIIESNERGKELMRNNERGAMHLAIVNSIQLPQGYRNVENARWREAGVEDKSGAVKMIGQLEIRDHDAAALLQLHADRGMTAARDLVEAGKISRDGGFAEVALQLEARPVLKAKYDADPAFRAGFDALVWAKQHDTKAYEDMIQDLDARDRCYLQNGISFRA